MKKHVIPFVLAVIASVLIFVMASNYVDILKTIRLTQWYGFSALGLLYVLLLGHTFHIKKVDLLIVPLICFMLLHAVFGFFGEIGGLDGLSVLPTPFFVGVIIGASAFSVILLLLIAFLFSKINDNTLRVVWGLLYLLGHISVFHTLIVGTHLLSYENIYLRVIAVALVVLWIGTARAIDAAIKTATIITILITFGCGVFLALIFTQTTTRILPNLNIHSKPMATAGTQSHSMSDMMPAMETFPGMRGDKTKRYTVSFDEPTAIDANKDTTLSFKVNDAANGNPVVLFQTVYTKLSHLVVVDEELEYFTHIHPIQKGENLEIQTQFPHAGRYHLYLSFQPFGAIEQQFAFVVDVGPTVINKPGQEASFELQKTFGDVIVSLKDDRFDANRMTDGNQALVFTLTDKKGTPLNNIEPYLGAFGHLVMVNTETFDYAHVHPTVLATNPTAFGGPEITFLPMKIFDAIKPGRYRLFAQFAPDGNLFTADFAITIY